MRGPTGYIDFRYAAGDHKSVMGFISKYIKVAMVGLQNQSLFLIASSSFARDEALSFKLLSLLEDPALPMRCMFSTAKIMLLYSFWLYNNCVFLQNVEVIQ